jgi:hypothetical protein
MKTQLLKFHQQNRLWKQIGITLIAIFGLFLLLGSCSDSYVGEEGDEDDEGDEPLSLTTELPPERSLETLPVVSPSTFDLETVAPKAVAQNRKLASNTVLKRPARKGRGSLKVSNGTDRDAYLKLVASSKLVAAFYVKANSDYTLKRIPDNNYQLLFVSGEDWDGKSRTFTRNATFTKFDEPLNFVTTRETEGRTIRTRYSVFSVTLHSVINGDAPTSAIDEQEFNSK